MQSVREVGMLSPTNRHNSSRGGASLLQLRERISPERMSSRHYVHAVRDEMELQNILTMTQPGQYSELDQCR